MHILYMSLCISSSQFFSIRPIQSTKVNGPNHPITFASQAISGRYMAGHFWSMNDILVLSASIEKATGNERVYLSCVYYLACLISLISLISLPGA